MANKTREPLVHISRRSTLPWYQSWGIRACALILSLGVCALVTMFTTGENPLSVFGAIYDASFSSQRRTWVLFQNIAMLLSVSLAVVPAFKMRFWNLGGEGQMLAGALATTACMICLRDVLPNGVLIPVMIICSIAAGALWGFIPAFFKAKWGTNETLFTLMMNYIAIQLVSFFIIVWEMPKGAGQIGIINQSTEIGWLPAVAGQKYLLNIIVVAVLTVFMFIYMKYSKHGYEISVVGESVRTTITGGRGFTAVMVAWLAKFNPIWMILTSFLLVFLDKGAGDISTKFGLNKSFSDILTGIILFFIIGSEFFINYRISFRHSAKKEETEHV